MTREELLRNLIAEIDFIMHDKDYRFVESEDTWYSRESCRVLTNAEVFEEIRAELIQLNNETNSEIAELKKKLALTEKALELACEMLCGLTVWDKLGFDKAIKDNCDYFKQQAKKEMSDGI